jgi:hypothetical protein
MKLANGEEHITWNWPSSGRQDDRWYDWRRKHWGCKWDIHDVEVDYQKAANLVHLTFVTPWCPPDGIYNKLCDMGYEFLQWQWQDECEDAVHDLVPLGGSGMTIYLKEECNQCLRLHNQKTQK